MLKSTVMRNVNYLYLKDNFMFPKFSWNMKDEKMFYGLNIPYSDSKRSLFSYHVDKTEGSPDTRRKPFFVLIIVSPFYLPLHYQTRCSDSGFITNDPFQLPHDPLHYVLAVFGFFW